MCEIKPVVALVSAVPGAIAPAESALRDIFPSATVWNILDDRLLTEAAQQGGVSGALAARMRRLIDHAVLGGADAVLLTCSMYSSVAQEYSTSSTVPVFGPDDALFEAAAAGGYRRVTVVSSAADPLADSLARIARALDADVCLTGVVAEDATEAVRAGDVAALTSAVTSAVAPVLHSSDAVVLGQYSLAPSARAVAEALGLPTLSGPDTAVRKVMATLRGAIA